MLPISFICLLHERGSQTLSHFSVLPLIMTVPLGFIARLYIEFLQPLIEEAKKEM